MKSSGTLQLTSHPDVKRVFDNYPNHVRKKICGLRKLIIQTAEKLDGVSHLEETLKWAEPSYVTKHGSTLRIDWKEKAPHQYAMYFNCSSRLVPSFKSVFGDIFKYEGNRAIIFDLEESLPEQHLSHCIAAALTYHKIKHLPMLGL